MKSFVAIVLALIAAFAAVDAQFGMYPYGVMSPYNMPYGMLGYGVPAYGMMQQGLNENANANTNVNNNNNAATGFGRFF